MAARLHAALLADTLAAARACAADERTLWWASEAPGETRVDADGFAQSVQFAGDLGARLERVFEHLLAGQQGRAVIVGSDCPALTTAHLDAAFTALAGHDLVVGAARDGGYWLIGLACDAPALFRDVPWGADTVCALTLSRAAELRLRVAQLPTLADLDTPADLAALVGECARDGAAACGEATRTALRAFGLLP